MNTFYNLKLEEINELGTDFPSHLQPSTQAKRKAKRVLRLAIEAYSDWSKLDPIFNFITVNHHKNRITLCIGTEYSVIDFNCYNDGSLGFAELPRIKGESQRNYDVVHNLTNLEITTLINPKFGAKPDLEFKSETAVELEPKSRKVRSKKSSKAGWEE